MSDARTPARLKDELAPLNWGAAHRTPIQMRYSDTDAMGHVNNAVYVQYLETSRVVMMRELTGGDDQVRSVVARLELDYGREVKLGQEVIVESLVERLGRKSWTIVSRIVADGVPSAFARTVEVRVNEANEPTLLGSLPDLLRPYLLEVQA